MVFWLFCTGMSLLIPLMMLGFGRRFQTHPPKSINSFYGYRTARSMKNRQNWDLSFGDSAAACGAGGQYLARGAGVKA